LIPEEQAFSVETIGRTLSGGNDVLAAAAAESGRGDSAGGHLLLKIASLFLNMAC